MHGQKNNKLRNYIFIYLFICITQGLMMVQTTETGCLYENIQLCQTVFVYLLNRFNLDEFLSSRLWPRRTVSTYLASPCEIFGGPSDTETGVSLTNSVFPCRYDSTNVPYLSSPKSWFCRKNKMRRLGAFRKEWSFGNRGTLNRKILSLS